MVDQNTSQEGSRLQGLVHHKPPLTIGRLKLGKEQVRVIEAERAKELAEGKQPLVAQLARLRVALPQAKCYCLDPLPHLKRYR